MPWITRQKLAEIETRIADLERHFVTKRDVNGIATETLADVPLERRKERKLSMRGVSMQQRLRILEETDGGRRA